MGLKTFFREKTLDKFVSRQEVMETFSHSKLGDIPVVIIGFNNGVYVKNMVDQLNQYSIVPLILDNASTDSNSIDLFEELAQQGNALYIRCPINFGHEVLFMTPIYNLMPDVFACTDPDLKFNEQMPDTFLTDLLNLTNEFHVFKAGLALTLKDQMQEMTYELKSKRPLRLNKKYSVSEWEQQFWRFKLKSRSKLEVYAAAVDTTFCVCNKLYFNGNILDGIRVAEDYACYHLPWYPEIDLMSRDEKELYANTKLASTGVWSKISKN